MPATDGTLVRGVLHGDRAAFAELYDRRARLIRAIMYDETRNVDTAADLTQDVFLRAFHKLDQLHHPDRFGAWLTGIARRVCREWRRRRQRELRGMTRLWRRPVEDDATARSQERLAEARDEVASLLGADGPAGGLSEKERWALHAYYLQEQSVPEACRLLGLSRSGFHRVVSRACQRLRRARRRQGMYP